jgi:hypothetical protein
MMMENDRLWSTPREMVLQREEAELLRGASKARGSSSSREAAIC